MPYLASPQQWDKTGDFVTVVVAAAAAFARIVAAVRDGTAVVVAVEDERWCPDSVQHKLKEETMHTDQMIVKGGSCEL